MKRTETSHEDGAHFSRYMHIQRQEHEQYTKLREERELIYNKERQLERENNFAREFDNLKRKDICDIKRRQQIRENSPELRDLERKLKGAYMNKELAAQIAQNEAVKLNEKIQEIKTYEQLQAAMVEEREYNKMLAEKKMIKKAQYCQELQDQMILKEKSRRYLYEEFLREKQMIDDIIKRIHDEDERNMAERMCRMKRTKEDMLAFKAAQEKWKMKRKEEIEEENRKIQEFLLQKGAEMKERNAAKKKMDDAKAMIQENICKQIYTERMKTQEREEILRELLLEQQKDIMEKKYKEELENKIRGRLETRESLAAQMAEHADKLKQQAKEDAKYKEELMAKLAEDEKLEQLTTQKKRLKMIQLRKDVEQMIFEKRQRKATEMQLLIKLEEQNEREMEERKRIIEEERIRMLREHVKNLIGFLPKGLLKPEDLPHLGM